MPSSSSSSNCERFFWYVLKISYIMWSINFDIHLCIPIYIEEASVRQKFIDCYAIGISRGWHISKPSTDFLIIFSSLAILQLSAKIQRELIFYDDVDVPVNMLREWFNIHQQLLCMLISYFHVIFNFSSLIMLKYATRLILYISQWVRKRKTFFFDTAWKNLVKNNMFIVFIHVLFFLLYPLDELHSREQCNFTMQIWNVLPTHFYTNLIYMLSRWNSNSLAA